MLDLNETVDSPCAPEPDNSGLDLKLNDELTYRQGHEPVVLGTTQMLETDSYCHKFTFNWNHVMLSPEPSPEFV